MLFSILFTPKPVKTKNCKFKNDPNKCTFYLIQVQDLDYRRWTLPQKGQEETLEYKKNSQSSPMIDHFMNFLFSY